MIPAGLPRLLVVATVVLSVGCARLPARPTDPLSAEEHNDLGVAYYRHGEYETASREFAKALALHPGFALALVNLGDTRLAQGALEAAIEAYEEAHAVEPEDPAIANNLAWALLQHERRWPEAEPLIRGALARRPEPRGYYLDTLGLLLLRQGDPGQALDVFRAALADPALQDVAPRGLVLRHAGDALGHLGATAAAERCYRLAGGLRGPAGGGPSTETPAAAEVGARDAVC